MPCLNDLPFEVLTNIARHLVVHEIHFPSDTVEINYDLNDGQSTKGAYWALGRSLPRRCYGDGFEHQYTTRAEEHKSLLSLATASKRFSMAAEECIYRHAIVRDSRSQNLCNMLAALAGSKSHLQPRMKTLMVEFTPQRTRRSLGQGLETQHWQDGVRVRLVPGLRNMATLRCLDLTWSPHNQTNHLEEWYKVLPKLPALRKLSLRHFYGIDWRFPDLPQVQEAHFYSCYTTASNDTPWKSKRSSIVSLFQRLPALHALIVTESFYGGVPEEAFEPFENTLETLAWMDAGGDTGCQQPVLRLKNLKHLKVDEIGYLMNDEFGLSIPSNLACTLETIELALNNVSSQSFWEFGLFHFESEVRFLENLLSVLEMMCPYMCPRLRVVDIRSYPIAHLNLMPDMQEATSERCDRARVMMDASRLRLEDKGVILLHDEIELPADQSAHESDDDDEESADEQYGAVTYEWGNWESHQEAGHTLGENEGGDYDDWRPYVFTQ